MHWLTKILAVFAAVLSVLLAALSIAYSTNAGRVTDGYTSISEKHRASVSELSAERTARVASDTSQAVALADAKNQSIDLEQRFAVIERENGKLLADLKQIEASAAAFQSRMDQLAAVSQTQANLIDSMYDEVTKLRDSELVYSQREIQLTDRLNDLGAENEVALESIRALQERLADIQRASGGRSVARGDGQRPLAGTPIRAQVTEIRRDPVSGALMAQIDAGTADRIRSGMELTISRRAVGFIGKLTIESATLNEATGRIGLTGRGRSVQAGDIVSVVR